MANLGYGFYPAHPGEIVKDELEARGITQSRFAETIGMGASVLNEILNGRRNITPITALTFEAALNIPADSLMRLQTKYNMHIARQDTSLLAKLKLISKAASVL
jgi:addiction module HigA family antidote